MKLVVSKNAFGLVASLLLFAVMFSPYALLRSLGLPWWVSLLYAVALGVAIGPLKRRWALLDWLFGGNAHIDAIRIGHISFILLSAPDYTTKRKLITCCIFVFWFSSVVIPIVLWNDDDGVAIVVLLFALISGPLILNTIEKRWLAARQG
jgi:hypothetical protein